MTTLIILRTSLLVSAFFQIQASDPSLDKDWKKFRSKHHRVYESVEEEAKRRAIFEDRVAYINKHNAEEALGLWKFKLGVNKFADRTLEEYAQRPLFPPKRKLEFKDAFSQTHRIRNQTRQKRASPTAFDWRTKGVVTAVRNQGDCGSCWAFASSSALESAYAIKTGTLLVLSPQNYVDCINDGTGRTNKCSGSYCDKAFGWAGSAGGITTESAYPYVHPALNSSATVTACKKISVNATRVKPTGAFMTTTEDALLDAVATISPVTVQINSVSINMAMYTSGVYSDPSCANTQKDINHAMLAVGYGVLTDGTLYWILKNSHGASWGEGGYLRLLRGKNECGIALWSWYPTV